MKNEIPIECPAKLGPEACAYAWVKPAPHALTSLDHRAVAPDQVVVDHRSDQAVGAFHVA